MSKFWENIGTIRTTKTGKKILVINKDVEIRKNGEVLDLGEFRTIYLSSSTDSVQRRQASGKLENEKAEKLLNYIEEKGITHDAVIPPTAES